MDGHESRNHHPAGLYRLKVISPPHLVPMSSDLNQHIRMLSARLTPNPHTHVLCSHLWAGRLENGPRTKD